jgi:hypothetical protein
VKVLFNHNYVFHGLANDMRNLHSWIFGLTVILLADGTAWGQTVPSAMPAGALEANSAGQRPTLAVPGSAEPLPERNPQFAEGNRKDLQDLLMVEIGNQPFLKLIDRQLNIPLEKPLLEKDHEDYINDS